MSAIALRHQLKMSIDKEKSLVSDMNPGQEEKQGDFLQGAINTAQIISEQNRDGLWCSGADWDFLCLFHTMLFFCKILLFVLDNNDSLSP